MDADSRLRRLLARCVKAVSFFLHPVRGPLAVIASLLVAAIVFEHVPGTPHALRPYSRFKAKRAAKLLSEGIEARRNGDLHTARLSIESALALTPRSFPARLAIATVLVDEQRFDEAAREAARAGMDGPNFVHDLLFHEARDLQLLAYCARQAVASKLPGVWLQSALMTTRRVSAEDRARIADTWPPKPVPAALLLQAILAWDRPTDVRRLLEHRAATAPLEPSDIVIALELLLQSGQPDSAWLWFEKYRQNLAEFDAKCAEYRLASVRDPMFAPTILASFARVEPMTDARWARLAAMVAADNAAAADTFCRMLGEARSRPPAPLAVAAWCLLVIHRREAAAAQWEQAYRTAGGVALPLLAGRKLTDPDPLARAHAVRLLAATTPLPREMIAALLMR